MSENYENDEKNKNKKKFLNTHANEKKTKKYAGMKHSPEPHELPFPIKLLNKSLFTKK